MTKRKVHTAAGRAKTPRKDSAVKRNLMHYTRQLTSLGTLNLVIVKSIEKELESL